MSSVSLNVRDLNPTERSALERVVGCTLDEGQRLVIEVLPMTNDQPDATSNIPSDELPPWCDVYQGLTAEQVDDLERAIVRSNSSRDVA